VTSFGPRVEVAVARVRAEVARLHGELVRYRLAAWTSGSVSSRVPGADLFVIKPTGLGYDELAPENMVLCDLDGTVIPDTPGADSAPSDDVATHAYVYRNMPEVAGVVHTQSAYATAWAARGEELPCVLTIVAEEFGGPVPAAVAAEIGDDVVGPSIVEALAGQRSPAVLLRGHGPFTVGPTAADAVRAAVMLESAARTIELARASGTLTPIPQDSIDRLYRRSQVLSSEAVVGR
jgi:L-ribulose-5-phosphate 4-epimerase